MAHSVLVVPVPEAEPIVRPRLALSSPTMLPVDDTVVAHVSLLGPFLTAENLDDGELGELHGFFENVLPFGFSLTEVSTFPGGTTYLSPDPAAPFRRLTHALHRMFPEFAARSIERDTFDRVVPHVTVPLGPGEDPGSLSRALAASLPIEAHAVEAALVWYAEDSTRTLATFPFGSSAA